MSEIINNPFEAIWEKLNNIEDFFKHMPNNANTVEYLLIDAAALFLSSTPNAIRVMASKKQIPHCKKQGKLFFKKADLIEWLESGRVEVSQFTGDDLLIVKNKGAKKYE